MITFVMVIIIAIGAFIVAFISPKHGTGAQRTSANLLDKSKSAISSWPKIIRKIVGTPPKLSHKAVEKSAEAGKKSRKKLSRK